MSMVLGWRGSTSRGTNVQKWIDPILLVVATGCLFAGLEYEFWTMGRYVFGGIAAVTYFTVAVRAFRR